MEFVLAESVVKKMGEMAVQPALNEVSMLYNFEDDFAWLKLRFREISSILNEADGESSRQKESVKNWLHRVRDIAWEAENILEESAVDSLYATNAQFCILSCKQLIFRHQMGTRIQKVRALLSSVVEDGKLLNKRVRADAAESSSSSQGQPSKQWSLPPHDSKPVGIQSKIQSMATLMKNPQIPIIAVVGMGGIGKTYLLQHVYNSWKESYDKSAWLSVSQFYSVSELQRDLAYDLDENLCKKISECRISEEKAAELIHAFMLENRCLIVLDDVWKRDLPTKLGIRVREDSRCKIVVTTRDKNVFENPIVKIYEIELLTEEESWRLFCAHAFPELEENRPPEKLGEVARRISEECGKLPLAIKITAASLARTTLLSEWQSKLSMLEMVGTSISDHQYVMKILKLSYHSLPAHLKACFAYLSFFPEDEVIECEYLIHLWMEEGFIPDGEDPWNCLYQLLNLCLVEAWEEEWTLKKYCKVHDLLLEMAIIISRENRCAFSVEDAFSKLHSSHTVGGQWCRLFLAKKDIDERAISDRRPVSPALVRTLSLSRNMEIGGNIQGMLFDGMRVLRVLDLSHSSISTLPASVGKMKLLRVLNLSGTKIEKVPESVRYLKSLTYLNLSGCGGSERSLQAPKWISELKRLQHLEGPFEKMPSGMSKLESLRRVRITGERWLSLSMEEHDGMLTLEEVGKMRQIEEIRFQVKHESQLKRIEEGILNNLTNMRRLDIRNKIAGMQSVSERLSAMRLLQHLRLEFFDVPAWICCLENLKFLYLQNCDCSDYPEFQAMPSLVSLWLDVNRRCKELPRAFGEPGGFPRLRFFSIHDFPQLEVFPKIEDGAMPCLEKLELWDCRKVNKMGEGFEQLKGLKEISFKYSGTDELRETFKEGGSGTEELSETVKEGRIYWQKIKASNPEIVIKY